MVGIFAQSVAEYGLLQSMAASIQKMSAIAGAWVADAGPGTWLVVGVIVILALRSLGRRRS